MVSDLINLPADIEGKILGDSIDIEGDNRSDGAIVDGCGDNIAGS